MQINNIVISFNGQNDGKGHNPHTMAEGDAVTSDFTKIMNDLNNIRTEFNKVATMLNTTNIATTASDVATIKGQITTINNTLTTINTNITNLQNSITTLNTWRTNTIDPEMTRIKWELDSDTTIVSSGRDAMGIYTVTTEYINQTSDIKLRQSTLTNKDPTTQKYKNRTVKKFKNVGSGSGQSVVYNISKPIEYDSDGNIIKF